LICSPTDQHAPQIHEAVRHKKHIFCEKPIALDLTVVDAAVKAAEEAGVKMMVGFNRRFDANFRRIKRAIVEGEIGSVNMVIQTTTICATYVSVTHLYYNNDVATIIHIFIRCALPVETRVRPRLATLR
jgi:hypothetical protein